MQEDKIGTRSSSPQPCVLKTSGFIANRKMALETKGLHRLNNPPRQIHILVYNLESLIYALKIQAILGTIIGGILNKISPPTPIPNLSSTKDC